MTSLQTIVSLGLLGLGALVALLNARVLVRQLRGKHAPSAIPLIGGIFLFVGALLLPGAHLRTWAVSGLFVDYGCMPYLIGVSIHMLREARRHSAKNRLLSLTYVAQQCSGAFHLYPHEECVHEWKARDGMSQGSMLLKVERFVPNESLELSLEQIRIVLVTEAGKWVLGSESGWHNQMHSLARSTMTEMAANTTMQADGSSGRR